MIVRQLGTQDYIPIWNAMQSFTDNRDKDTPDEIWLVEHNPVFTQGQAGKEEHILAPGDIPIVQVDRGGQVTYHGPGQQMMYILLDIRRLKTGVRELVTALEQCIVNTLSKDGIEAYPKADAPGVYVNQQKVCSVGLRIRKGCSFHGLAFNVNMDLAPFQRINPCGYQGLEMTDSARLGGIANMQDAGKAIVQAFCSLLNIQDLQFIEGFNE
ncbi:lipoyl(octanoyl) transferase LipB [Planctobacterium marinum]|uniref:lipoyl(octanoyl) transferase LipB n=1 Tax=Planctobacterium marinum TaxID=1631968 RepID=UPI001E65359F|nr:lipoyl(octanoyl) transferase LipB [Planctobacterium marinum]MCC2605626.1 lipoyl(octanoyl) transferase LipB [Planctobacterium marinum]